MFRPDKDLRETILDLVASDGKSISAIHRDLQERKVDVHRLILTGYLRALTDLKIVKEMDVPPSKVYTPARQRDPDIYEAVGDTARRIMPAADADRLILYSLLKLFNRPVFLEELRAAGVKASIGHVVTPEKRAEAKNFLKKGKIKVPDSSPAFTLEGADLQPRFEALMATMILDSLNASALVMREPARQVKIIESDE